MIVPAFIEIKKMSQNDQNAMRSFFRKLVSTKFVIQSMGQEASEEKLELMYDSGFLKFSVEPGEEGACVWRVLLYDQRINAYMITDHIKFEIENEVKP